MGIPSESYIHVEKTAVVVAPNRLDLRLEMLLKKNESKLFRSLTKKVSYPQFQLQMRGELILPFVSCILNTNWGIFLLH